ncbi:MAG: hypothetical protein U0Q18_27655 [Bryobacteraceae bacterium]
MPIDINAILQPFLFRFQFECRHLAEALKQLGDHFKDQLARENAVEAKTRDYPEFSFTGGALDVSLTERQAHELGALLPRHEPMMDMIRQEFLLTDFLRVARDMTRRIRESMEKLPDAVPRMFDINRPREFGEVFGILGVLSRAVFSDMRSSRSMIRRMPFFALITRLSLIMAFDYDTAASSETPSESGGLDRIPVVLAGVLVAIPTAIDWMDKLISKLDLAIRLALLRTLQSLEQSIDQIRIRVIRFFAEDFMAFGQELTDYLLAFSTVFEMNMDYMMRFIRLVVDVLVPRMIRLVQEIREFINSWRDIMAIAMVIMEKIYDWVTSMIPGSGVFDLANLIDDLLRPDRFVGKPSFLMSPFPDIGPLLLAPIKTRLAGSMSDLKTDVTSFVTDTFASTTGMMQDLGRAFSGSIGPMLAMGGKDRWSGMASDADAIVQRYFHGSTERQTNELGEAFDRAIAARGIDAAGGAIGAYVVSVAEWWCRKKRDNPTSPHILADRAHRLRVKLPRLTVRVTGAHIDDGDLPGAIAARMKDAIESAWQQGLALDTGAAR